MILVDVVGAGITQHVGDVQAESNANVNLSEGKNNENPGGMALLVHSCGVECDMLLLFSSFYFCYFTSYYTLEDNVNLILPCQQ